MRTQALQWLVLWGTMLAVSAEAEGAGPPVRPFYSAELRRVADTRSTSARATGTPSRDLFERWKRRRSTRAARNAVAAGIQEAADRTTGWWRELPEAESYARILDDETRTTGSLSLGTTSNGEIRRSTRLPTEGPHHSVIERHRNRGTQWATDEMVELVRRTAASVAESYPDSTLRIGNLGYRGGGDIPWSVSHNSGRDADFAFYCRDAETGDRIEAPGLVAFDEEGRGVEKRSLAFDTARNWELVESLLREPTADIQWMFISRPLKRMLLDYARSRGVPEFLVRRASEVLHQPTGSSPHNDHLHVRITCSRTDRLRGCLNYGPRWDWVDWYRDDLLARSLELRRAIRRGSEETQVAALDYLHRIRSPYAPEMALTAGVDAESERVRSRALEVATDVKWWSATAVAEAIELVRSPDRPLATKRRAYEILRREHSERARRTALSRLLDDDVSRDEKLHASRALAHVVEPGLVPVLLDLLGETTGRVREACARTLRRITGFRAVSSWRDIGPAGSRRALERWRDWWRSHRRESRESWLRRAFRKHGFEGETVFDREGIGELVALLLDTPDHVSYAANRALHRITGRWVPFEGWSKQRLHDHWNDWWEVERHSKTAQ